MLLEIRWSISFSYVSCLLFVSIHTFPCAFLSLSSFLPSLSSFCPRSPLLLSREPGCLASFFHTGAVLHSITGLAWRTRGRNDLQRSAHRRQLSLSHPTIHSATLLHWIHSGASPELMFLRRDADGWKDIRRRGRKQG